MIFVNLAAGIATKPEDLAKMDDPIGSYADYALTLAFAVYDEV